MNTADRYFEPNKLPAGILAVLVHGVFFALLYFGFSWQTLPSASMSVELWQSLPEAADAQPVQSKIEEVVPPPQPEEVIKPDIALPDKKKVETKPVVADKKSETKPVVKPGPSSEELQAAREQAERDAAIGRVVDEYTGKIRGKIKRNVVMPPDVPNTASTEFSVTLLPGGSVLNARLTKSSGNALYDNAVERAILKSQPLPLPPDVSLFSRFRELRLVFKPVD
ncbi:MAG: cell envelope integrity protein TolA [Gallionella sp.]|nr:cell envelope integrity protein TolA [Gallionella sp.]